MVLAKLMQELQRHTEQPFELVFLVMDPGYAPANRALIEENAARLGIPITVFRSDIFDVAYQVEKNPCYLCADAPGFLYSKAQELGCNKIALGTISPTCWRPRCWACFTVPSSRPCPPSSAAEISQAWN